MNQPISYMYYAHTVTDSQPEEVILLFDKCRGREWEIRGDCVLQCVLCENVHNMTALVEQHKTGTGLWMNTDN